MPYQNSPPPEDMRRLSADVHAIFLIALDIIERNGIPLRSAVNVLQSERYRSTPPSMCLPAEILPIHLDKQ